jgi:DNA-binding protein
VSEPDVVYIGEKPVSTYVLYILERLKKGSRKILVKARGHNISKAAHVTEAVHRMSGGKTKYGDIRLYSEEVGEESEEKSVPAIEIEVISLL